MSLKPIIKTKILWACRDINEFKKGYQPRINIIKDENGNLLAYPQSVLNRWENFFNQLLSVLGFMMLGKWVFI
jgi:hypothetical protein